MTLLLSASQASLKGECDRKYAFTYVAGLRQPSTPSQALGTEVDDTQLQPYLRDGKPFDYSRESGYIAAAGLAHLPKPGTPGLEVQKRFVMPSPSRKFAWQGYLDLWLPSGGMPEECSGPFLPTVGDFKTTKNINSWAKTPETLKTDPQAQLYATWAMFETGARLVDLHWIYFQTQGAKKTKKVFVRVDADHVYGQFLELEKTGKEIVALREGAGDRDPQEYALSLTPNPEACENFGGCPFKPLCNLGPAEFIDSIEASKKRLPVIGGPVEAFDLFASLEKKAAVQDAPSVMGMSDRDVPAPTSMPFESINPPEQALPPAPPVGTVEAKEPKKRGRPKKDTSSAVKTGAELVKEMEANASDVANAAGGDVTVQTLTPQPTPAIDFNRISQSCLAISAAFQTLAEQFKAVA